MFSSNIDEKAKQASTIFSMGWGGGGGGAIDF